MTSFITPICGSHGSSGNGARDLRPWVVARGGLPGLQTLGLRRGVLLLGGLASVSSIAGRLTPESFFACCRSAAASTALRSAATEAAAIDATTSSFAAVSIALWTWAALYFSW